MTIWRIENKIAKATFYHLIDDLKGQITPIEEFDMSFKIFFSSSTSFFWKDFELKLNERVMNLKVLKLIIWQF
jgi:hypothetical protein